MTAEKATPGRGYIYVEMTIKDPEGFKQYTALSAPAVHAAGGRYIVRQPSASDLGAMAKRVGAKYLVLTHLIPMIGAERHGIWKIPGGVLSEAEYRKVVQDSGFTGSTVVGTDLATIRLPAK